MLLRLTPPWPINHDCGWYLYVAHRLLVGDGLYVEVIDVNPPLIVYLSLVPAALARWTSAGVVPWFNVCVVGLLGVSLWWTRRIARRARESALTDPVVLAATAFVLTVVPGQDFGQREHLMVLFALPYFTVVATRLGGADLSTRMSFATGLFAAVGMCLKPHFLLAPLLVRIGTAVLQRRLFEIRRPENEGLIAGVILYGLHFFLLPNLSGFAQTIDLAWEVYGGYDVPLGEVLLRPWMVRALTLCGLLLVGAALVRRDRLIIFVLLLAQLGFFGAAVLQAKGWSYHVLPAILVAGVGLIVCWCANRSPIPRAILLIGLLGYGVPPLGQRWLQRSEADGSIQMAAEFTGLPRGFEAAAALRPGDGLLVLDTRMHTFFAWMADRRLRWCSRYACLWVLPGARQSRRDLFRQQVTQDLAKGRPRLVYVRSGRLRHVADPNFDVLVWLRSDPEGRRIWSEYEPAGEVSEFTVWKRRTD